MKCVNCGKEFQVHRSEFLCENCLMCIACKNGLIKNGTLEILCHHCSDNSNFDIIIPSNDYPKICNKFRLEYKNDWAKQNI